MSRTLNKVFKVLLWMIAGIIALVIFVIIAVNIPAVQDLIKNKVISYLKRKTDTEISLERIRISFPKNLELNKFYIADKKKDTLLYAGELVVDLDMLALLSNKVEVNNIELHRVRGNVYRVHPDTVFNYQFLVDSLMPNQQQPEEEKKNTTAPLQFDLDRIVFDDIRLKFKDDVVGNDAGLFIGNLNAKVDKFDLERMHYVLDQLELSNTQLLYFQNKPLTTLQQAAAQTIDSTKERSGGSLPLIEFKNFSFDNVSLNYDDRLSDTRATALLKTVGFKDLMLDLTNGRYGSTETNLSNSVIDFAYRPTPSNEEAVKKAADSAGQSPFSLYLDKIILANNRIKYDDLSAPHLKDRFDYNHLDITGLGISGTGIAIDSSGIKASINGGKLKDASGFVLNELRGDLVYDDQQIKVDKFLLRTPNTYIDNTSLLSYTSQEDLSKRPEKVQVAINFRNSVLGMQDAYYFVSAVPASYRSQNIYLSAAVTGTLNNIDIDKFQCNGLRSTQVDIAGNIRGLPDMNKTWFNLDIRKFATSKSDLNVLLPKGSLPSDIEIPNRIAANGKFTGSMNNFATHLDVRSDMGSAKINAAMRGPFSNPSYKAKLNLSKFNVGRLLKRSDVGMVSLFLDVAGSGIDAKTAKATVKGTVYNAYYNKYNYKNIKLDGKWANQALQLKSSSTDSNVHFDLATNINISGRYPSIKGTLDLKKVDLQKLNFATSELKLAGLAEIDFPTADPDYLNGAAHITSLQVVTDGKIVNLDTVTLDALSTATNNSLQFNSDILSANLEGKYRLTQLGQLFINQINKYYAFGKSEKITPQKLRFNVAVNDSKIIQQFVPELTSFAPSNIGGVIDSETDSLLVNANFPHVVYDSFDVKHVTLAINNKNHNQLDYELAIESLESPSIQLYNSVVNGNAANNVLGVNVFLRDSKKQDKYVIGGNFKADNNQNYQFSLDPQKLLLNYDKWQVAPDNLIQYGKGGVYVRNFEITNSGQSLSANSVSMTANAPVKVEFKNFMLETLTRFAEQDTSLVGGTLNGTVDIKDMMADPKFEANLVVNKLRYQKDQLGDLRLISDNYTKDAYKIDAALTGPHDIKATGYYYTSGKSSLDMVLNVNKIDLKYIESLSGGQIRNGSGTLSGQLTAKGPVESPKILGNLNFKDAGMNITQLNSYFRLRDENISFVEDGIRFNNFTMLDSLNQPLTLNGAIHTKDYQNYRFALRLRASNFRILHSTASDNELFYGTAFVNANATIGGDMNKPEVTGTLKVNKDTRFYLVIPDSDPSVVSQEGIVEFVDMDAPPNNGRGALNADSVIRSPLKGFDISMNVLTDKGAEISIIVDPQNGDALLVKGEAALSAQMDPSGKISMTGRYLISDGNYNLSIGGLARRKFSLQQGSYIQWTGDPTEANINITAVYNVNTSAMDLVADQIQGLDQTEQTRYKQKLPFMVYLKMTGELMKPVIRFEIDMPPKERNAFSGVVYTRLQQVNTNESELNKQVFALLALNRFVSDNPFQSLAGGTSAAMIARQSVSKLLTQQLNNLASDLVKGVELSFDLASSDDYTTGTQKTRTDLNVSLSKRLLNDRLTITVGSDFALEGPQKSNGQGSNIAGNVNIEYALSRDGRYRLRAYRRNQNEGVIEGQIIETGLGFALVVDYNQFREVFDSFKKRERTGDSDSSR